MEVALIRSKGAVRRALRITGVLFPLIMSKFSGSFRRFKEGLQWNLLRDYWVTIREHAWETLWGTSILGIAFVFYTLYRAPSLQFLGFGWLRG